jgi:hypothetical protein
LPCERVSIDSDRQESQVTDGYTTQVVESSSRLIVLVPDHDLTTRRTAQHHLETGGLVAMEHNLATKDYQTNENNRFSYKNWSDLISADKQFLVK